MVAPKLYDDFRWWILFAHAQIFGACGGMSMLYTDQINVRTCRLWVFRWYFQRIWAGRKQAESWRWPNASKCSWWWNWCWFKWCFCRCQEVVKLRWLPSGGCQLPRADDAQPNSASLDWGLTLSERNREVGDRAWFPQTT